jgi:hypothetical protein
MVLRPRQRRVSDDVGHDVGQLVHLVHDLVDVDAVVVGDLGRDSPMSKNYS